jgi:medium-chain acyl-[acyl-carrier-protein] hydrolase
LPLARAALHSLPEAELLKELRKLRGTPEQILRNDELLRMLLPTLRADLAVCENYDYRPERPLDCPITVFGGLQDSTASMEEHAAWNAQTRGPFTLHMFPGDHFFLHSAKERFLSTLFGQLQRLLCTMGPVNQR